MKREKQEDATLIKKGAKRQSEIKKRAAQAKERLKMGYWTRLPVERAEFLKKLPKIAKEYDRFSGRAISAKT